MDPLQHDPKTKQQIKEALYEFLYTPLLKAYKTRLDTIIVKNSLTTRSPHMAFIYKGETYTSQAKGLPRRAVRLSPEFHPEMDEYLAELKELNDHEVPFVLGFINQVLNSTNELHDYLKVLPDAVHRPITTLIATCPCRAKSLSEQDADYLIKGNSHAISLIKRRLVNNLLH